MPAETYLTPWDTVAEFQISNSISETPGQIFKLSERILISGRGFESAFVDILEIRHRLRVSSNFEF